MKTKITDRIINILIQRGLNGDVKNLKTTIEIPREPSECQTITMYGDGKVIDLIKPDVDLDPIKITITVEALQIKVEKE
jgi:hypothetical protein